MTAARARGSRAARGFGLLLLVGMLTACSSTKLRDTWRDEAYTGPGYKKVLVIGIAELPARRKSFEDTFAAALGQAGVVAVPSHRVLAVSGRIEEERLRQAVAESGAEAVLLTRLMSLDTRSEYQRGYISIVPRAGFYGYYGAAWGHYTPAATYDYKVVGLETNLWDVETEKLVWAGATESFAPQTVKQETEAFSQVVINALRAADLI